MYYLVIQNLGNSQCILQSPTNIFKNNMAVDCTQDLGYPLGANYVGAISVRCNGSTASTPASIYQK